MTADTCKALTVAASFDVADDHEAAIIGALAQQYRNNNTLASAVVAKIAGDNFEGLRKQRWLPDIAMVRKWTTAFGNRMADV